MSRDDATRLPIHPAQETSPADDDTPVCSPKIYVSNEEASLLRAIHLLRDRALGLRRQLDGAIPPADRRALELELERLRRDREVLVRRRDEAFRRKMVMLGHLPPEALDEEIIL